MPARSRKSRPKCTFMLLPISQKRGIFSMGNANSRNKKKWGSFYFWFWKTEFPQFNYARWWYDIHLQVINSYYRCFVHFTVVFLSFNKNKYWPYGTRVGIQYYILVMQSMGRRFESHQGCAIFHLIKFRLFQENCSYSKMGTVARVWLAFCVLTFTNYIYMIFNSDNNNL